MELHQIPASRFSFEGWKSVAHLRDALRQADSSEVFDFLYPVAAGDFTHHYSYIARRLLLHLNPPCQLSCEDAIKAMCGGWNVSDREVPFYLFKQFGLSELIFAIERIHAEDSTDKQKHIADVVLYWADIAAKSGPIVTNDLLGIEDE